jgi:hypothetical protein
MNERKKWEYKIEAAARVLASWMTINLDALGEEGWEAVGIFWDGKQSQTYVLFKREKRA